MMQLTVTQGTTDDWADVNLEDPVLNEMDDQVDEWAGLSWVTDPEILEATQTFDFFDIVSLSLA